MLDLSRYQNLTAFDTSTFGGGSPKLSTYIGFHSDTLEVAQLSAEVFGSFERIDLKSSKIPSIFKSALPESLKWEVQEWNQDQKPLQKKNESGFKVKSVNINVTQICNLKCTYCAAGGDGTYGDPVKRIEIEKTLPQLRFFISKLHPGERFHVSFLGGEPLLFPEGIRAICEYVRGAAKEKDFKPSFKITTNGTILNQQVIDILKEFKPTVVVSMDGKPEVIDKFRPQKNKSSTSEAIVKNLDTLNTMRDSIGTLAVHAVFTKDHTAVLETYEYFRQFRFDWIDFIYSVSDSDTLSNELYMQQVALTAEKAWSLGGEQELRKIYLFDNYFDRLDSQEKLENHCGLGKSLAVIDSRNQIFNCPWTVGQSENRLGQGLIIDEAKTEQYEESIIERNDCGSCWARYMCGGGCSFIHDTTAKKDTQKKSLQFCERTRFLLALSIYYFALSREGNEEAEAIG